MFLSKSDGARGCARHTCAAQDRKGHFLVSCPRLPRQYACPIGARKQEASRRLRLRFRRELAGSISPESRRTRKRSASAWDGSVFLRGQWSNALPGKRRRRKGELSLSVFPTQHARVRQRLDGLAGDLLGKPNATSSRRGSAKTGQTTAPPRPCGPREATAMWCARNGVADLHRQASRHRSGPCNRSSGRRPT